MKWSSKGWRLVVRSWWLTCRSSGSVRLGRWNTLRVGSELRDHVRGRHDEVERARSERTCAIEARKGQSKLDVGNPRQYGIGDPNL